MKHELVVNNTTLFDIMCNIASNYIGKPNYKDIWNKRINELDISNVTDLENIFKDIPGCVTPLIENWDTSSVINMRELFIHDYDLEINQDLSNWKLDSLQIIDSMFYNTNITMDIIKDWGWIKQRPDLNWEDVFIDPYENVEITITISVNDDAPYEEHKVLRDDPNTISIVTFPRRPPALEGIGLPYRKTIHGLPEKYDPILDGMPFKYKYANTDKLTSDINYSDYLEAKIDIHELFSFMVNFNQPLDQWDTSRVTNMGDLFSYSINFNQDISKWDVSNVTNMTRMFLYAKSFNQDLSNWDISSVTNIRSMFYNTSIRLIDIVNWGWCDQRPDLDWRLAFRYSIEDSRRRYWYHNRYTEYYAGTNYTQKAIEIPLSQIHFGY